MARIMRWFAVVFMVAAIAAPLWSPNIVIAQDEAALQEPLTPEAVREMASRLSDAEVRDLLLRRLDADAVKVATEEETAPTLGETLQAAAISFGLTVTHAVKGVPNYSIIRLELSTSFVRAWAKVAG